MNTGVARMGKWTSGRLGRIGRGVAVGCVCVCAAFMLGCQADFAADIHNKAPQPLFAQVMLKSNDGTSATVGASRRLGPGDRALVGPVRTNKDAGAYLVLDTLPNPSRPVTLDLRPGVSFLVVTQDPPTNDGVLRIEEKP